MMMVAFLPPACPDQHAVPGAACRGAWPNCSPARSVPWPAWRAAVACGWYLGQLAEPSYLKCELLTARIKTQLLRRGAFSEESPPPAPRQPGNS